MLEPFNCFVINKCDIYNTYSYLIEKINKKKHIKAWIHDQQLTQAHLTTKIEVIPWVN